MKVQITTKDINVPTRVLNHAEMRIQELEHLFREPPEAAAVFSVKNGKYVLELTLFAGSTIFRAVEATAEIMVVIDAAVSSIRRELRDFSDKLPEQVNTKAFDEEADEFIFIPEVENASSPSYTVVRSKEFPFGPLTVEEAILQMNLIGHAFFAFRNTDRDDAFSVVYKRNDGGYGVLVDTMK